MEARAGGGGLTDVVRVGDTVRRTTGPWTPAVHALLRHLERVGFDAAPRVLGTDEHGREILTYVDGEVDVAPDDAALAHVARLVRAYHEATRSFVAPPDARWQRLVGAPPGGDVVCHNDLAPYNTVFRDRHPVAFVDWDLAAPGPPLWDVAWAVYRYVPLYRNAAAAYARRIRVFCDAYGLDDRGGLFDAIDARIQALYDSAREWGEEGRAGWRDVWRDTRGRQWLDGRAFVAEQRDAWSREL